MVPGDSQRQAVQCRRGEPRRLPVILSPEEVARLLDHAPGLMHRAALSMSYGSGLRAGEVVSLKPSDIDSDRMVIRVEQSKPLTPRDISFDMVVDLNPKFDFELSKFISHLNAKYTIGFKSDYSDRFYNIQLDVPPSGFLERGYKQMYNIIPTL